MPESKTRKKAPAKKAAPKKSVVRPRPTSVTPADEWMAQAEGQLTELPSGKVVRMRMPGMQAFIASDLIPNELMPIVMQGISLFKPPSEKQLEELRDDPDLLMKVATTMDRVFAYCVTEPQFEPTPTKVSANGRLLIDPSQKEPGVMYTDIVDEQDKSYVFQVAVGGTRDLARFREEQATIVEALSSGQDLVGSPQRDDGDN